MRDEILRMADIVLEEVQELHANNKDEMQALAKIAGAAHHLRELMNRGVFSEVEMIRWMDADKTAPTNREIKIVTTENKRGFRSWNRAYYDGEDWHGTGSMSGVIAWADLEPYQGGTEK